MYLDEIVSAQKHGEAKGVTSICSAHPWVLKAAMQRNPRHLLIEATCNQVNQFGGYTGMTPMDFVHYVREIAGENHFPFENVVLGGDHLGPNAWQAEPAESAMQKSAVMARDYVQAGFVKIHLDCNMSLEGDSKGVLDMEVSASRAAKLAKVAESSIRSGGPLPRYVIGTEVPIPGGLRDHEDGVNVTKAEDAHQTIDVTRKAFYEEGLHSAWERVVAIVVQPGLEFGDDFVLGYEPEKASELSSFIEGQPTIYEAHSTDYQTRDALKKLVEGHFAILKVGPGLTFAFREAVCALAMVEDELFSMDERSNIIQILDGAMLEHPEYWEKYYRGTEVEQAFKRKYSFSDRIRYYWSQPQVQLSLDGLLKNLNKKSLPLSLLSQFMPVQYEKIKSKEIARTPEAIILDYIRAVLLDYEAACG